MMKLYLHIPSGKQLTKQGQDDAHQLRESVLTLDCDDEAALLARLDSIAEMTPSVQLEDAFVMQIQDCTAISPEDALSSTLPFGMYYARKKHPWLLGDMPNSIQMHFQPIIDFSQKGKIFGYEALCRVLGPNGKLLTGEEAFRLADQLHCTHELDGHCQLKALEGKAKSIPKGTPLFINVLPQTIMQKQWLGGFLQQLDILGIDQRDIIIEIMESEEVEPELLAEYCDEIRCHGLRIALDDMGSGFNGLRTLAAVRADFIKIDRAIVHEAQGSRVRTVLLEAIISMAQRLGCTVVAEGLERVEDITFCQDLGLSYAQGYYFARPNIVPPVVINAMPARDESHRSHIPDEFRLVEYVTPGITMDLNTTIEEAKAVFMRHPDTAVAILLDHHQPLGLLKRGKVFSLKHGSLGNCCEPLPKLVNHATPASLLARSLYLERGEAAPWVLIGEEGNYLGILQPLEIMAQLISRKSSTGSLHPLSQLTTGPSLRQALDMSLRNNPSTTLVYIDLDHFKAYNDRYGFIRGDAMIRLLAEILRLIFLGQSYTLVGHIGGDDFVLIMEREQPGLIPALLGVISRFQALAMHLYDDTDLERGYFTTDDGKEHPVASISIGIVNGKQGRPANSVAAAERAAMLKKIGKNNYGSIIVVEDEPPRLVEPSEDYYSDWQTRALEALQHMMTIKRSSDPHALDSCFTEFPFFEVIFELDANGIQRYPNWINPSMYGKIKAGGSGIDRAPLPYYQVLSETLLPYFSSIYLSTATEDFCLTISLPMLDDQGVLDGVLVADINIAAMAMLSSAPIASVN
jgi:diguanylate cyclase (GGDEF)-like protein